MDGLIAILMKEGYPLYIFGENGIPAALCGIRNIENGKYVALYKYPDGVKRHSLEDVKKFKTL